MRRCGQAEHLERQHREDARHQVQQHAAGKGQQQRLPPPDRRILGRRRHGTARCARSHTPARSRRRALRTATTPASVSGRVAVGPLVRASTRSMPPARFSCFGSAEASMTPAAYGKNDTSRPVDAGDRLGRQGQAQLLRRRPRTAPGTRRVAAGGRGRRRTASRRTGSAAARRRRPAVRAASLCLAGDADVGADEPGSVRLEAQRSPGFEARWHGDRHQQIGRAAIAVIADAALDKPLRHRPGDLAGAEAGRQLPGDLGRQAGIAGVAPVGVPARRDVEMQVDPQRLAGHDRGAFGDQPRRNRAERRRRGGTLRGGRAGEQHGCHHQPT